MSGPLARIITATTLTALAVGLAGCTSVTTSSSAPSTDGAAAPSVTATGAPTGAPAAEPAGDLASDLRYLIEEEKLAHDVYLTLSSQWGGQIFENIAAAEETHANSVAALLTDYGIDDPRRDAVGSFADPSLQALYDQLVAEGTQSRAAAIDVGITIEETDIADLTERIATAPDDVAIVLERLLSGSQNHLSAFERQRA